MLVDTMCLNFFTVVCPTLLYIFLANLSLYICMIFNSAISSSIVVTTLEFSVVYVVLKTYIPYLFLMILTIPLLVLTVESSSWYESYVTLYSLTKLVSENIFAQGLIIVPQFTIVWDHRLLLVDFGSHISK